MIIILKEHSPQEKLDHLLLELKNKGLDTHPIVGETPSSIPAMLPASNSWSSRWPTP